MCKNASEPVVIPPRRGIGRLLLDFFRSVVKFLLVAVGGTALFLIVAPVLGYVPYGDRPGPGMHFEPLSLSWQALLVNAELVLGWSLLLSIYDVVVAIFLIAVIRGLERISLPRIGVRIAGGVVGGILSGYVTFGVGWYIGIGVPAILVSLLLGATCGSFILPRDSVERKYNDNS